MPETYVHHAKKPIVWTLGQIVELVRDVSELHCLKELTAEADRLGISVHVPAETVNFVKNFLFEGGHHKNSHKTQELLRCATCIPRTLPPGGPPRFPPPGPGDPEPF